MLERQPKTSSCIIPGRPCAPTYLFIYVPAPINHGRTHSAPPPPQPRNVTWNERVLGEVYMLLLAANQIGFPVSPAGAARHCFYLCIYVAPRTTTTYTAHHHHHHPKTSARRWPERGTSFVSPTKKMFMESLNGAAPPYVCFLLRCSPKKPRPHTQRAHHKTTTITTATTLTHPQRTTTTPKRRQEGGATEGCHLFPPTKNKFMYPVRALRPYVCVSTLHQETTTTPTEHDHHLETWVRRWLE